MEFDALSWNVVFLAATLGIVHTAAGPDHYLPFVMLARARRWSTRRMLSITALCGAGHVVSSLALGLLGVLLGVAVGSLETVEGGRGGIAAWAMVAFGAAYAIWGLRRAYRQRRDLALHDHGHGHVHIHTGGRKPHAHPVRADASFWALFMVFVLGPCEPMIPLFMLPASQGRWELASVAAVVFCACTLATMLVITAVARAGFERLPLGPLERWLHPVSGGVIAAAGLLMVYGF